MTQRLHQRLGSGPGIALEHAQRAGKRAVHRDRVRGPSRIDRTPDDRDSGARIDPPRQQAGQVGDDPADRVDEVGGEMRTGGVPAGSGEADVELVAGCGDRTGPHADPSGLDPRITVQREDLLDALERARRDHTGRTAGHGLLGGLEHQPHPTG